MQKCNKIQKGSLLGSSAAGIEILEDDIGKICDMTENVKKIWKLKTYREITSISKVAISKNYYDSLNQNYTVKHLIFDWYPAYRW